jgi:hypothetical protein
MLQLKKNAATMCLAFHLRRKCYLLFLLNAKFGHALFQRVRQLRTKEMSMQNKSEKYITEEGFELKFYPQEMEEVLISLPKLTLEAMEKVAKRKDLPLKALLKFYIGQGLRQDLTPAESKELFQKRMKSRKDVKEKSEVDLAA